MAGLVPPYNRSAFDNLWLWSPALISARKEGKL